VAAAEPCGIVDAVNPTPYANQDTEKGTQDSKSELTMRICAARPRYSCATSKVSFRKINIQIGGFALKNKRFNVAQIVAVLKQGEQGCPRLEPRAMRA
jgi:hypothetical protein